MATEQSVPKVLIFDDFIDPIYRELAQEGAEAAEWEPHVFDDPDDAFSEFNVSFGALVTALGTSRGILNILRGNFPSRTLVASSDELHIPRAIMSGHPWAQDFVREDSLDILIPKGRAEEIPDAVSGWLRRIARSVDVS